MDKHGEISFIWEDYIFMVTVEDSFNEQAIEYYAPILQKTVLNRSIHKWKRLELWDDEALGCSKTLALAKGVYDWYEINGCILTAVVISNVLQSHIIKNVFQSNAKVFLDKEKLIERLNLNNKNFK